MLYYTFEHLLIRALAFYAIGYCFGQMVVNVLHGEGNSKGVLSGIAVIGLVCACILANRGIQQ